MASFDFFTLPEFLQDLIILKGRVQHIPGTYAQQKLYREGLVACLLHTVRMDIFSCHVVMVRMKNKDFCTQRQKITVHSIYFLFIVANCLRRYRAISRQEERARPFLREDERESHIGLSFVAAHRLPHIAMS